MAGSPRSTSIPGDIRGVDNFSMDEAEHQDLKDDGIAPFPSSSRLQAAELLLQWNPRPNRVGPEDFLNAFCRGEDALDDPAFDAGGNVALKAYLQEQFIPGLPVTSTAPRSQWLMSLITGESKLHPAEVSGASRDPNLQLLGIPREIRDKIVRYVLVGEKEIPLRFRSYAVAERASATSGVHREMDDTVRGHDCTVTQIWKPDGQVHALGLLFTCSQMYEEGRVIFYGENVWVDTSAGDFPAFYSEGNFYMSRSNAALVKKARLQRCLSFPDGLDGSLDAFTSFASHWLPNLQKLQLRFYVFKASPSDPQTIYSFVKERFLITTADMTQNHPALKKAIWNTDSVAPYKFSLNFGAELTVPGHSDEELFKVRTEEIDEEGRRHFIPQNLILDCQKIRQTNRADLSRLQPWDLALPEMATSSEPLVWT
ncbi:uncharacterized protein Z519_03229 [Cladophialophora bantiana CBS 173.52]|uniref:Uncharacterized protein n=1 Tax=Cladophialophora bantiana (strain ATCC 10958 / CBS 173.52 / CDC B-1940 / NIH 8579) TaxID=1442370 RepID=A0A0D2GCG8_CLAB1|nr:uncharacterized protein Z519_03229 [Cladophialophora bantiana CBS 173.52]KIW96162.1 hypothetical protein Z519_03229 [Cladophialophora bantiana CBS 173.52]